MYDNINGLLLITGHPRLDEMSSAKAQ